jgi:MFS family permease
VGAAPAGLPRRQLVFAAAGVLLAATDTYVVVVALPAIMTGVGIGLDQLQRATPVVSGFLLGYVAVLPLIGRLADVVGKRPVFAACLTAFAFGSVVTATSHSLGLLVAGRAIQGLGGGGLVPVTLALVAEHWPVSSRGLPLGAIGAVQELGSVLGPLYGAVIVTEAGWRWIFWLNLPLSAVVAVGYLVSRPNGGTTAGPADGAVTEPARDERHRDVVGVSLAVLVAGAAFLALDAPSTLAQGVLTGRLYSPLAHATGAAPLTTPMAMIAAGLAVVLVAWEVVAPPTVAALVDARRALIVIRQADLPGAALVAGILACVVIAFSTTDPSTQIVASSTVVLGPLAVVFAVGLVWRQRHAAHPLIATRELAARPAWGAMLVNLAVGAALVVALIDVPLFARSTRYPGSQVGAALILLRLLAAVPFGAVAGGVAIRRAGRGALVAGGGMALAAAAFAAMTSWSSTALSHHLGGLPFGASDVELVACGLGFGLAIAPVNAAVLAAVPARIHGLATSLVVVARTVGMLVGVSVLTAVALHRFYAAEARIASPIRLCPTHPLACPSYERASTAALLSELHTIFAGAAVFALAAVALSPLLRPPHPRTSALVQGTPP